MKREDEIVLARMANMRYKLDTFDDAALKELYRIYNNLVKRLQVELLGADAPTTKARKAAVLGEVAVASEAINARMTASTAGAIGVSGKWSYDQINAIASWDGLTPGWENVSMTASQIEQLVTNQKLGGKSLNEWVGTALMPDIQSIKDEALAGQVSGEGYKSIVRRIQNELSLSPKNKRDMESVVKTYIHSMNVKAQQDVYEANSEIISEIEWTAILENGNTKTGKGTCPRCMALDGNRYPVNDRNRPNCPLHVRCRCMFLPVTKTWRELGFDIDEMEDAYRPWNIRNEKGGIQEYGSTDQNYADWWKTRSKTFQDNAIGPVRAEMVRSGQIDFSDIVDNRGNLILLKDLQTVEIEINPLKSGYSLTSLGNTAFAEDGYLVAIAECLT